MAAEIQPRPQARKPCLLSKIEAFQEVVTAAAIIPKEDGVISVSEDRTIRVWLKRDSGQYWPSVYHTMPCKFPLSVFMSALLLIPFSQSDWFSENNTNNTLSQLATDASCSCMSFNPETRRLSVGMDTGSICEFILSEDYNKMTPALTYQAHQGRVAVVLFVLEMEWLLSTGQDRNFTWHCSESGQQLGTYRTAAWVSGLQYPSTPLHPHCYRRLQVTSLCRGGMANIHMKGFEFETRHAFVGDQSGQVTILKLEQDSCSLVTTFKGHTGNVTALCWDPAQRVLFSGSSDHSIIMWDIGGRKGTAIELQGHNDKVQGLCYASHTRQLISCSSDGSIVIWNMDVTRQETPEWLDSDSCQKCEQPFFWNFKQMWDSKKIGLRQHHCRKCGQAVCGKCSSKRSTIPLMGFEFEVRVCDSCHESITDEE
ncbi:hypothetical protein CCH79_00015946 [Gambusia affinis]|uniref:FYVE-type domain-containing protein n=1 Tax=Gambusia affinis TaxID=33528 RepID=A0A315W107_GAMAF|nr:hypothetical protein CCH79_00015946 [Gambusia affinis]